MGSLHRTAKGVCYSQVVRETGTGSGYLVGVSARPVVILSYWLRRAPHLPADYVAIPEPKNLQCSN